MVDGLQQEYAGKVEFRLINTDNHKDTQALSRQYRVTAVPTFVFLNKDGSEAGRLMGEIAVEDMRAQLDALK